MTFKIHAVSAADAADRIGPYDGIAEAVFVDSDGNPIDIAGGSAPTTIPTGALVPGAGINLVRGEDGAITASVKDKGITAGMLADGVAVSGPKGDPGAAGAPGVKGADGKSVTAIALTADAAGKITGGTVTFSDKTTAPITVTTATA